MIIRFMDMHSGGGCKETPYEKILIEADSEDKGKIIFQNRFGHNPERVTCTCCGEDYSVSENEDLAQATGYDRNCKYENGRYVEEVDAKWDEKAVLVPLAEYLARPNVLFIPASEIKPEEREGELIEEGYVWR